MVDFKIENLRDDDNHPVCAGQNIVIGAKASGGSPNVSRHPKKSSAPLTTYKSLYVEVVDSYKTGVFLADDAPQGSTTAVLHFPANDEFAHPITELADQIGCSLGERNEDPPLVWYDCEGSKPYVGFFDKYMRPEAPTSDRAYISRLEYTLNMLINDRVTAYLENENGDEYSIARYGGYKAGWDSDADEGAAITNCAPGTSPCQPETFSFFSEYTGTENEQELLTEADFIFSFAYTVPEIVHPGRAMPNLFPIHLQRDGLLFSTILKNAIDLLRELSEEMKTST